MAVYPSSSAIPSALAAFVGIAQAALPADSTVYYGSELGAYSAPVTLWISEITGDQKPAEIGGTYRREEKFSLVCSLIQYEGGTPDFVAQLAGLMANFALISKAVGNNPWLSPDGTKANGTVRFAQVGGFHISSETDANGESATTMDFSVRCEQRVESLS